MDEQKLREDLLGLIREKAVIRGERKLASGEISNYYIDGKQVTLSAQGLFLTAKVMLHMIQGTGANAIGGPTLGADPIAAAVSVLSSQSGNPLKAFIVRKETKDHGMQRMIEGPALEPGDKVIMVEDVITTGGSVLKAIKEVEKLGAKVVKTLCLVDRNEGAIFFFYDYDYS